MNAALNLWVLYAMELVNLVRYLLAHLGRPRCRWEDSNRINLKKIVVSTRNWVDSARVRDYWRALVNAALNLWVL